MFNFAKIEFEYHGTQPGSAGSKTGWDIQGNRKM
jgi:hypothetical protein